MHIGTNLNAVTQIGDTYSRDFLATTQFTPQITTSSASSSIARLRRDASDCICVVAKATRCVGLNAPDRWSRKMCWKDQIAATRMLFN